MKSLYLKIILILLSFIYISHAGIDDGIFNINSKDNLYFNSNYLNNQICLCVTNYPTLVSVDGKEPYDITLSEKYNGKIIIGTNIYKLKHNYVTNIIDTMVLEKIN